MTSSDRRLPRTAPLAAIATFALLTLAACGGGGGGGGPTSMMPPGDDGGSGSGNGAGGDTGGDTPSGTNATYTASVVGDTFGSLPVTVSADAITVANQTINLNSASQVGTRAGHHRAFDSAGATSGPATEVHYFGQRDGYSYIQFGSWAKGVVSPNPGFRVGEQFGAFLAPTAGSRPTPVSNLPTTGSATWRGSYAGYVDREGVGVSQVVGAAEILVHFFSPNQFGDTGALAVFFDSPDPSRSSFAPLIESRSRETGYNLRVGLVQMTAPITGNTFDGDVTDTRTVLGHTVPGGTTIATDPQGGLLYSLGSANSGGLSGGFFGSRGGEAGGTYQFTVGATKAVGSFGGKLQ